MVFFIPLYFSFLTFVIGRKKTNNKQMALFWLSKEENFPEGTNCRFILQANYLLP
jgi:hypothetical protein